MTTVTGSITAGGPPVTVTIATPGDTAELTFAGAVGQRIFAQFSNNTINTGLSQARAYIRSPDGSSLPLGSQIDSSAYGGVYFYNSVIDKVTLPVNGTYTLVMIPLATQTGSVTVTLYDVPPDASASVVPASGAGSATSLTTTTPGQNLAVSFSGTPGQRIFAQFSNNTINTGLSQARAYIRSPDGSSLPLGSQIDSSAYGGVYFYNSVIDSVVLPASGTYTVVADPMRTQTGSVTVTLYDVPPDASPELQLLTDGSSFTFTNATPGQNAAATFDGLPGQDVLVRFTDKTFGGSGCTSSVSSAIVRPDGSTLTSKSSLCANDSIGSVTLSADGVYTLTVNPQRTALGSITATVYLDEPEVTPSGAFFDDVVYVNGSEHYPLALSAHFPRGIQRAWVEEVGVGQIASSTNCDAAMTTCPIDVDVAASVDTAPLAEGMHEYVAKAIGPNNRASADETWRIFIDRTSPPSVSNIRVDSFDNSDSSAVIAWDEGPDPDLPDGVDGAGAAGYDYRYQPAGGMWSSWQSSDAASFPLASALPGSTVNVEVRELDGAGNASPTAAAAITVAGTESSPTATEVAEGTFTGNVAPLDANIPEGDTATLSFTQSTSCAVTYDDNPSSATWRFTNCDGTWDIYRDCTDQNMSGGRFTVGPGYIAHMRTPGANGRVLIRDDRIRTSDKEFISGNDTPFGPLGAFNGGLGTFGFQYARSTNSPGSVPAGTDPTRQLTDVETQVISGGTRDARRVPVIEGRQCAGKNGNPNYGVYAVTHPPKLTAAGQPNNPSTDTQGNVHFTVSVWFRDEFGNTGYGPNAAGDANTDGDAIARVTYTYIFYASVVKSWIVTTTYGSTDSAGGTRYVKQPTISAVVRGGGFTRMKVFGGGKGAKPLPHTPKFPSEVTDGPVQTPAQGLSPRQIGYRDRTRVQWDYGDNSCANSNCFSVAMRSYPVVSRSAGGVRPGAFAPMWQQTENGSTRGFGLDWWARISGTKWQRRLQSYPRDTRGDVLWSCIYAPAALTETAKAQRSESVTTNVTERRRWEIGGWKQTKTSAPFLAAGALFSGWNGGRGPYDCEQMQVKFADTTESFGTFASYSVGPGWALR
ncbi:MAG: hypothetical protein ACJ757_08595 [Gaiellaceae bacterium]